MVSVRSQIAFLAALLAVCAAAFTSAVSPVHAHADEPKTVPLLVIVVGFDGGNGQAAQAVPYDDSYNWGETIFGRGDTLASYYSDMSNGTFTFSPAAETSAFGKDGNSNKPDRENDGIVHIVLHQPHDAWGLVNENPDVAQEFGKVVLEAFQVAGAYVDYSSFDANGDGLLTPEELAVCLCVAGYDASPFKNYDRTDIPVIWPHSGQLANNSDSENSAAGIRLDTYIAIAEQLTYDEGTPTKVEQEPLGVLYHELGHFLGLIDLYPLNKDADAGAWGGYRVGALSLMDNGAWASVPDNRAINGYANEPTALDAWSRYVLGWHMPSIATQSGDYRISSQLSNDGYSQLLIPTSDPDEYFLLENRQPEGHDTALATEFADGNPFGGIVIWHINKDTYRRYGIDNQANDTYHAPAVMEQFFEESGGTYTTDLKRGKPVLDEPFYDSAICNANLGNASEAIALPLYSDDDDKPSARTPSGTTVQIIGDSAQDMTVRVNLVSNVAGISSQAYLFDKIARREIHEGDSALARIACSALARETDADVAIVDARSIRGGLPAGDLTYDDVYAVLPRDENIVCYDLTGAQLIELAERSVDAAAPYISVSRALTAIGAFSMVDATRLPNPEDVAPSGDAVLAFAGLQFDIDWTGPSGVRTSNVTVGGEPVNLETTYYVAMTPGVMDQYSFFDGLNPNRLILWGSPADALRSFVQTKDWEQAAR